MPSGQDRNHPYIRRHQCNNGRRYTIHITFAENMGERSKERGGGLSEGMAIRITGGLMEDVEMDTVGDLSSLTDKLEATLKEKGEWGCG